MQLKSRVAFAAALGALLSLSSVAARAMTLQEDLVGTGLGENITLSVNGSNENTFAGQINSSMYTGTGYTTLYASGDTFCVDLFTHNSIGDKFLVELSTTTATNLKNGGELAYLYDKYELGTHGSGNVITTNDQAAGLQLAIWKLLYDGTTNLSTGEVQYTTAGNVLTDANSYLTDAVAHPYSDQTTWLDATFGGTQSPTGQGQLGPTQVPEGGFFGLLGSVTSAGAALRYRRIRALRAKSGKQ